LRAGRLGWPGRQASVIVSSVNLSATTGAVAGMACIVAAFWRPRMIHLRAYRDSTDREAIIQLWQEVFGYETAHNEPGLAIDRKLAHRDDLFWVAQGPAGLLGTVMAGYDGHRGWLYSVAVHPACRGQGLGRQLVQHAEQALQALGCLKINLQLVAINGATAAFYEAMGYAVEPRISMGKVLKDNLP
jgi:ribosomal protein S18 acetylase RimI-like enzyme